ncbi:MAG: saccharopine dehydrogenase C-terminal domain-containing protein [Candidatus Natronoplasma sp.]
MNKAVVFGAGHVAGPHVRYLLEKGYEITVASRTVSKAEDKVEGYENGKSVEFDINDQEMLDELVSQHDVAVSLLPYVFHEKVARSCIRNGKQMVTTSYVSDEIRALDNEAEEAGILIMMETGVDPGTDHMSAMRVIHDVENRGGTVKSFESYCGGLPAPEDNDNPYGYKFSWSPKGVLLAGKNSAKYLKKGDIVKIPSEELFENHWPMDIPGFEEELEAYPNRNSLPYKEKYGLKDAETVFRGTLRYPGWCETMKCMVDLGLMDEEERDLSGMTYRDMMSELAGETTEEVAKHLKISVDSDPIQRMQWLGLFEDEPIPIEEGGYIDALVELMLDRMDYKEGEKDMLIMHHIFEAEFDDKQEKITSTMIDFGVAGGETSMARTVGLPAAMAVEMVLEGEIDETGVTIPVEPEIYEPILEKLEGEGIVFEEEKKEV